MVARAFEELMVFAERCAEVRDAPWNQASPLDDEMFSRMSRSSNPIVRSHGMTVTVGSHSSRMLRARLRLLRTAAVYRATGAILELDDPFGGKLLFRQRGSGLKIWSVGTDGTDDGGVGTWKLSGKNTDIVLEIAR